MILKHSSSSLFFCAKTIATHKPVPLDLVGPNGSAKVDVFDYAAQFNTLPNFETTQIPIGVGAKKMGFYVRVTVPGTRIVGEAYHPSARTHAEIGACVNFKKRAEELHQGEKMLVKHINTLTSSTGRKFLEYCKMKHKDWQQYKFVAKTTATEVNGQLFLGDRLLSECSMYKYLPF